MDGAHTHHHGPGGAGIGAALLIGAGLAVAIQVMNAIAAIVHVLLVGLACAAALALIALTVYAVIAYRRRLAAWQSASGWLRPTPEEVELPGDREVVSLRQAITELQAQLAAARALDAGHRPGAHQDLHFPKAKPTRAGRPSSSVSIVRLAAAAPTRKAGTKQLIGTISRRSPRLLGARSKQPFR